MDTAENNIKHEDILNILYINEYVKHLNKDYASNRSAEITDKLLECYSAIDENLREKITAKGSESECEYLEEEIDRETELNSLKEILQCLITELDDLYTPEEMEAFYVEISELVLQCKRNINTDTVTDLQHKRGIPEYPWHEAGDDIDYNHPAINFEQEMSSMHDLANACVERGIDDPDELISEWEDMMDRDADMAI